MTVWGLDSGDLGFQGRGARDWRGAKPQKRTEVPPSLQLAHAASTTYSLTSQPGPENPKIKEYPLNHITNPNMI